METSVVVLIAVVVLVIFAVIGYFVYKNMIEPRYHHDHMSESHHMSTEGHGDHMSMAGHLSHKMSKAKSHSSEAVKSIQHAKHHLNQAQMHAHA
jgi:hypothetical protein